jgi:putative chitinase
VEAPFGASLSAALRAVGFADVEAWAAALAEPMRRHGIHTPLRAAAFLANVAHESGGGRRLVEDLSYSAKRIAEVWPSRFPSAKAAEPYAGEPEKLANKVYAGRLGNYDPDDGWRFRGRGLIQVTGRANYTRLAKILGRPLYDLPAWLETPKGAAEGAALWWASNGLNDVADAGDIEAVRARVNGGLIGLADVRKRYAAAMQAVG